MHCPLTVRQYRQRLIANLPAVAERAVERRPPPQLREPGQRRRSVLHASGQQHPTRAFTPTVGQFQFEHIAGTLTRHHLTGPYFDGRVGGNLAPPGLVQLARRSAVVTQQPADAVGGQVALLTRVARPSTRPALKPAAPPPTTTQSHIEFMTRACPDLAVRSNLTLDMVDRY